VQTVAKYLEKKEAQRQINEVKRRQRRAAWQQLLHNTPMFEGMPTKLVTDFLDQCGRLKVGAGEVIFNKGDVAKDMLFIMHGVVQVYMPELGGVERIAVLRAGEVMGEGAVLGKEVADPLTGEVVLVLQYRTATANVVARSTRSEVSALHMLDCTVTQVE
jgi:CRP-like cAMP-binding protein